MKSCSTVPAISANTCYLLLMKLLAFSPPAPYLTAKPVSVANICCLPCSLSQAADFTATAGLQKCFIGHAKSPLCAFRSAFCLNKQATQTLLFFSLPEARRTDASVSYL